MIKVTKFNRAEYYLNACLIETVEATPDTVITLVNGKKLVVLDAVPDVLAAIEAYYRSIGLVSVQVRHNAEGTDVS